jgi:hypothetical protein
MKDEQELRELLRGLDGETVRTLTKVLRAMISSQAEPDRHKDLLARMDALTASGNVTPTSMRAMLAPWRGDWEGERIYTYGDAKARAEAEPELEAHRETILYDWPEGAEHWEWVCTAPVAEIVGWAEVVGEAPEEAVALGEA